MPKDIGDWYVLEMAAADIFPRYGCDEIRTPILERTDLFMHNIGDDTDIVQKEMYTFTDRGGRSLTMRPEGTAGVIRALVEITPDPVLYKGELAKQLGDLAGELAVECGLCPTEDDVISEGRLSETLAVS